MYYWLGDIGLQERRVLCEQMSTPAMGKQKLMPGHNSAPGRFTSSSSSLIPTSSFFKFSVLTSSLLHPPASVQLILSTNYQRCPTFLIRTSCPSFRTYLPSRLLQFFFFKLFIFFPILRTSYIIYFQLRS